MQTPRFLHGPSVRRCPRMIVHISGGSRLSICSLFQWLASELWYRRRRARHNVRMDTEPGFVVTVNRESTAKKVR